MDGAKNENATNNNCATDASLFYLEKKSILRTAPFGLGVLDAIIISFPNVSHSLGNVIGGSVISSSSDHVLFCL